jgi:hypothetical protein
VGVLKEVLLHLLLEVGAGRQLLLQSIDFLLYDVRREDCAPTVQHKIENGSEGPIPC